MDLSVYFEIVQLVLASGSRYCEILLSGLNRPMTAFREISLNNDIWMK